MKRLTATYIYADRHAIQVFTKRDKDAGEIEFIEVFEHFLPENCRVQFTGRLIVSEYQTGLISLFRRASVVCAREPLMGAGSSATQALGVAVGSLRIDCALGHFSFDSMPSVISSGWTYQPDVSENFDAGLCRWSDKHVAKIHAKNRKGEAVK